MQRDLLDTHTLIGWLSDPDRLTPEARAVIQNGAHAIHFSAGAVREMAIKQSLGRFLMPEDFEDILARARIEVLPVSTQHALAAGRLPYLRGHRDPFDRLQIAQAQLEAMTIVTRDEAFRHYDVAPIEA